MLVGVSRGVRVFGTSWDWTGAWCGVPGGVDRCVSWLGCLAGVWVVIPLLCGEGVPATKGDGVTVSAGVGQGKADFDHIYDCLDPREYFRVLGALDYEIPQRAQPVFEALVRELRSDPARVGGGSLRVLDLC